MGTVAGPVSWRRLRPRPETGCGPPAEFADIDARRIVEEASGWEGAEHHGHLDDQATTGAVARFERMLARRLQGEPLQYVLGRWGFRGLDLVVDRRALIPRPETEQVVDHALAHLDRLPNGPDRVVVDLGTGSGAIALSIAAERADVTVWGTDRSAEALAVARANLTGLGARAATRVRLAEGDWYRALPEELAGTVDLVVANPPYVADGEDLPPIVADWEPIEALVAGPTGLEATATIVAGAPSWLAPHGALVMEIGATQKPAAVTLAHRAGFTDVEVRPDLAGHDRALVARRSAQPPRR
ncbi:MAG: peptide chain release factor N(5)-glutamine methyltransferase [Acidimicrobiales bacterium]